MVCFLQFLCLNHPRLAFCGIAWSMAGLKVTFSVTPTSPTTFLKQILQLWTTGIYIHNFPADLTKLAWDFANIRSLQFHLLLDPSLVFSKHKILRQPLLNLESPVKQHTAQQTQAMLNQYLEVVWVKIPPTRPGKLLLTPLSSPYNECWCEATSWLEGTNVCISARFGLVTNVAIFVCA